MSAVAVTLVHWLFAVLGGLACLVFIAAAPAWKPAIPPLLVVPQLIWLAVVAALRGERPPTPGFSA